MSAEAEKHERVEPRLVALFTVVACIATAAAAIQVEMGPLFTLPASAPPRWRWSRG